MTASAPTRIRAVFFDLDDTLFAHRAAVDLGLRAYLATLENAFSGADAATALTLWNSLEEEHFQSYLAGDSDHASQRRARARAFAAAHGVELDEEESETWFARYFGHYADHWVLHDDVLGCFDALRAAMPQVRFGIITNGDRDYQQRKIERLGLTDRMDGVIASGEAGAAKPDARIFLTACERFGLAPGQTAYVGDRLRTDAIGAARAGMAGVWLNRTGDRPAAEEQAEATEASVVEVRTLTELPDALARREHPGAPG